MTSAEAEVGAVIPPAKAQHSGKPVGPSPEWRENPSCTSAVPANDLLEYQAKPLGGSTMPDVAGSILWPGIMRPGAADRSWATVAVGSQLGSQ